PLRALGCPHTRQNPPNHAKAPPRAPSLPNCGTNPNAIMAVDLKTNRAPHGATSCNTKPTKLQIKPTGQSVAYPSVLRPSRLNTSGRTAARSGGLATGRTLSGLAAVFAAAGLNCFT